MSEKNYLDICIKRKKTFLGVFLMSLLVLSLLRFGFFPKTQAEAIIMVNPNTDQNFASFINSYEAPYIMIDNASKQLQKVNSKEILDLFNKQIMSLQNRMDFKKQKQISTQSKFTMSKKLADGTFRVNANGASLSEQVSALNEYIDFTQKNVISRVLDVFSYLTSEEWRKTIRMSLLEVETEHENKLNHLELLKNAKKQRSLVTTNGLAQRKSVKDLEVEVSILDKKKARLVALLNDGVNSELKKLKISLSKFLNKEPNLPIKVIKKPYGPTMSSKVKAIVFLFFFVVISSILSLASVLVAEQFKLK